MPPSEQEQRDVATRRVKVLQLRAAGMTFETIADQCGHKTAAAAAQDFTRALESRKQILDEQTGLFLTLEMERLDALVRQVEATMAEAEAEGERLLVLRCTDRLLRISEHRSNLLRLAKASVPAARPEHDELPESGGAADVVTQFSAARAKRRARTARAAANPG